MPDLTQLDYDDAQEVLATRWLSVSQLEEAGIFCRKGPFVEQETQSIDEAIKRYQMEHKLNDDQIIDLVYSYSDASPSGFWSYVARAVPQRGVKSVFYHVRRARDCLGKSGKWEPAEDDQLLRAVKKHGTAWVAIADLVQRSPADCSDRYRQYLQYKDTKRRGAWSSEEESQLRCAIEKLAEGGMIDESARGFWVSVSKSLGGTRTPKQCRSKWSETHQGKNRKEGKTRWNRVDSYVLVCKIASLDVNEERDIEWKSLNDPSWNWSTRSLRQRWRKLKASINSSGDMSHRDVVHNLATRLKPYLAANISEQSEPSCHPHDSEPVSESPAHIS